MDEHQDFVENQPGHGQWEDFWLALLQQHRRNTADVESTQQRRPRKPPPPPSPLNPPANPPTPPPPPPSYEDEDGDGDVDAEAGAGAGAGAGAASGAVIVTTVETIVWSTTFVTVPAPTTTSNPLSSSIPGNPAVSRFEQVTSSRLDSPTSTPAIGQPLTTPWTGASSTVIDRPEPTLPSIVTPTPNLSATPTSALKPTLYDSSMPKAQKRAIIGGLSGTIVGLIFMGLLIFIGLRQRRKKFDARRERHLADAASQSEKGIRPGIVRKWNGLVSALPLSRGIPGTASSRPSSPWTVTVDEDHRIIRMSTRHWPRPFAPGGGEGYRDSMPPGALRVVNPDPSRPSSPSESYFRLQRDSLSWFRLGTPGSVRSLRTPHPPHDVPTIAVIDTTSSRSAKPAYARTLSDTSYRSDASLPTIHQQPPEDPFLTPPHSSSIDSNAPSLTPSRLQRPGLAVVQGAAGAASKTCSYIGHQLFQPFRSKSSENVARSCHSHDSSQNHLSVSTESSARRSDPFDLDKASVRGGK